MQRVYYAPIISPDSGTTFDKETLTISISCAAEDAEIHFTTNGATPTIESPLYKKFRIYGKTTVKAIAFYEDGTPSEMAVAEYAQGQCADPVISLANGSVFKHANQEVSISGGTDGTLRYTLDGSEPTAGSPVYAGPFTISETTMVKAKVFSGSFFDSQIVTSVLTREWEKVVAPTSTTSVASSGLSVLVDLGCEDADAELHYTLDGSEPTDESPIYSKPFYAFDATTLKVVAIKDDFANSDILTKDIAIYCVVDLSGGSEVLSYPVSYIVGIPSGGWTDEYKTTKLVLRKINAGSFIMGDDQTKEEHRVTVTKPFYMGVFEVTQKQWSLVMGFNPTKDNGAGDTYPVYYVSYEMIRGSLVGAQWPVSSAVDDTSFVGKLQARTGVALDLPTEAQWEYACRAGTTTIYYWGDSMNGDYAWHSKNSGNLTHVVGTRIPNNFDLYDMSGNAWEWCLDWAEELMFGVDPVGCSTGINRIQRGGAMGHADVQGFSSSGRAMNRPPTQIAKDFGFRLAMKSNCSKRPLISPSSGSIVEGSPLSVSMTFDSSNATIHYTTNGVTPTVESSVYKKFRISGKTTVKAIAFFEDGTPSEMAVAEYALGHCADPVISLADGSVFKHSNQGVSISGGADGTLRYTLDGSEPTVESSVYAGPFTISETTTVKAKVFSDSFFDSHVVTSTLTREWMKVSAPVISAGATFMGSREVVTITCETDGAAIYYTVDGSEPTKDSLLYRGAFNVKESCTVKAIAVFEDYLDSEPSSVVVSRVRGIGDVLGVPDVTFACSGAIDWAEDVNTAGMLGGNSMRSGAITHSQASVLSATVVGKGTLNFYAKTSCEDSDGYYDWDRLEFTADGDMQPFDGEHGWTKVDRTFTTDGPHTLTWTYIKDDGGSEGTDCVWISNMSWTRTDLDPLPVVGMDATPAEVDDALDGVVDSRLRSEITNGSDYVRFRTWVNKAVGSDFASHKAVKDSQQTWLSYALDGDKLLTKAPVQDEMKIAAFEKNATTGKFDFAVKIDGVNAGTGATAENLAKVFWLEGATAVDGDYSADNVVFTFGTPVDGKVVVSALPAGETVTHFFMKVKMNP